MAPVNDSELANLMHATQQQQDELLEIKSSPIFKIGKIVINLVHRICGGNLYSLIESKSSDLDYVNQSNDQQIENIYRKRVLETSNNFDWIDEANKRAFGFKRPVNKTILFCRCILCLTLVIIVRNLFVMRIQYRYDTYKFHLSRFRNAQKNTTSSDEVILWNYKRLGINESNLIEWTAITRLEAESVGSNLRDQAFVFETMGMAVVVLTPILTVGAISYFRWFDPVNFHYTRMLQNLELEQWNCNLMIQKKIESIIKASETFVKVNSEKFKYLLSSKSNELLTSSRLSKTFLHPTPPLTQIERARLAQHNWLRLCLHQLALSGSLQPLDRRPDRFIKSIQDQSVFIASNFIPAQFGVAALMWILGYKFESLIDWFSAITLHLIVSMLLITSFYYTAETAVYCTTQVNYSKDLIEMIRDFRNFNCQIFDSKFKHSNVVALENMELNQNVDLLQEASKICHWPLSDIEFNEINSRLVRIVCQYYLFIVQMRAAKATTRFLIGFSVIACAIYPGMCLLHLPYMQTKKQGLISSVIFSFNILFADISLVPICVMHSQCLKLYACLSSLNANLRLQISSVYSIQLNENKKIASSNSCLLYNEHIVTSIGRELKDSNRFSKQFVVKVFGVHLGYKTLLRIHFWMGVIVLAFYRRDPLESSQNQSINTRTGIAMSMNASLSLTRFAEDPLRIVAHLGPP